MTPKKVIYSVFLIAMFCSCDKNENNAIRLMNGQWNMAELTVNEIQLVDELPKIRTYGGEIYDQLLQGAWVIHYSDSSKFFWQFSDKGKTFKLSRISDDLPNQTTTSLVDQQTYEYSGSYKVLRRAKDEFVFESSETIGFSGQKVKMILRK